MGNLEGLIRSYIKGCAGPKDLLRALGMLGESTRKDPNVTSILIKVFFELGYRPAYWIKYGGHFGYPNTLMSQVYNGNPYTVVVEEILFYLEYNGKLSILIEGNIINALVGLNDV